MAHSQQDIERGLTALAICPDSKTAAEQTGFNERTLRYWRTHHPERWEHILANRARIIDQACIEEFRAIAQKAAHGSLIAVEREIANLQAGRTREPAQAALNLIKVAATSIDKVALMEGRPTSITEHRTTDDVLRSLEAKGYIVDAQAEEIEAA